MADIAFDEIRKIVAFTIRRHYNSTLQYVDDIENFITDITDIIYGPILEHYDETKSTLTTYVMKIVRRKVQRYVEQCNSEEFKKEIVSIDAPVPDTERVSYDEILPDTYYHSSEYIAVIQNMKERLFLNFRSKKDQTILKMLLEGYSLTEIGKAMNISRQCIQQATLRYREFLKKTFKITELSL